MKLEHFVRLIIWFSCPQKIYIYIFFDYSFTKMREKKLILNMRNTGIQAKDPIIKCCKIK